METYPYKGLSKEAFKEIEDCIQKAEKRLTDHIIESQKSPEQKLQSLVTKKLIEGRF